MIVKEPTTKEELKESKKTIKGLLKSPFITDEKSIKDLEYKLKAVNLKIQALV